MKCIYCDKNEIKITRSKPKYCSNCIKNRVWNHTRTFIKICKFCGKNFEGKTGNTEFCSDLCRLGGVKKCRCCKKEFTPFVYDAVYCKICEKDKIYQIGKVYDRERVEKGRRSMLKWTSSNKGNIHYKKLGIFNSSNLKSYFSTKKGKSQIKRVAKIQSIKLKEKIKNGEFTPNIHNRWTHWDATIHLDDGTIKKFRSSWEACVWFCNKSFSYEKIRVPYKTGSVIVDFVDYNNKIIYEIKPKSMYRKEKNKINAIINWCMNNEYTFIWINENNIMNYVDKSKFIDNLNISQLHKLESAL